MVVTVFPSALDTGLAQDLIACPFDKTVCRRRLGNAAAILVPVRPIDFVA